MPRAGINISEGTWGGHLLEHNDVFDTVLETGDHGSFNSWGRDRFWHPDRATMDSLVAAHPELIDLDAKTTTQQLCNGLGWTAATLDAGAQASAGAELRLGRRRKGIGGFTYQHDLRNALRSDPTTSQAAGADFRLKFSALSLDLGLKF